MFADTVPSTHFFKKPVFPPQKRRFSKNPKMVTYVDGPFFADENLSPKEKRRSLRNQVFETMCERSKLNEVELIKYEKLENTEQ